MKAKKEKFNGFKVGDKVWCNGYPGVIARLCEWSDAMVEVRLERGGVCTDAHELDMREATATAK